MSPHYLIRTGLGYGVWDSTLRVFVLRDVDFHTAHRAWLSC